MRQAVTTANADDYDPLLLLERLVEHNVDFVVIGGFAATLHGAEIPTHDLDISYGRSKENLERLANALQTLNVRLRGAEDLPLRIDAIFLRNGRMFTFTTPMGDLDVLSDPSGAPPYNQLKAHAVDVLLAGYMVRIASLDDLIAMKQTTGRTKDVAKLAELQALRKLDENQRE